jgi:hypothetical protein
MKKRAVYGTGIAALAPAAALMMPATATAAAHANPQAAKTEGKSVSRHAHGLTNTRSCTGVNKSTVTTFPFLQSAMWLWYTSYSQSACIGTVVGSTNLSKESKLRVRVWNHNTLEFSHLVDTRRSAGAWVASVGIHERFADPVKVCDAWKEGAFYSGGLCITRG